MAPEHKSLRKLERAGWLRCVIVSRGLKKAEPTFLGQGLVNIKFLCFQSHPTRV